MIARWFELETHGTSVRTEVLAGLTTFLTMAYIVVVNPAILAEAGIDHGAAFTATCLAAALGSVLMGLLANLPVALAPGMGLNAYFTWAVVLGMGQPWEVALGAVLVSGVAFLALSVLPVRTWLVRSIPEGLQHAITAGIGLFLGFLGLKGAGLVADHPATLVTMPDLWAPTPLLALFGLVLIAGLSARRVPGAVLVGILATTVLALLTGRASLEGVFATPPSVMPTLLAADVGAALTPALLPVVAAFLFVDLFDTTGTLVAVTREAGLVDEDGEVPHLSRAVLADSAATVAGAALGTSTTTSYIESAAGVQVGGRTGLTAVVVGLLFLGCLFFAPLARSVPEAATAPALLIVAAAMVRHLGHVDGSDPTEAVPALATALGIPLGFSIADGIGLGFVVYAGSKAAAGRVREVPLMVWLVGALFVTKALWM